MKKLLVRELVEGGVAGPVKVLSIFVIDEELGIDQFDSELSTVLSQNNLFERLHVVGLLGNLEKIQVWLQEGQVPGDRVRKVLRDFSSEVCYIIFDQFSGTHKVLNHELKIAEPPMHKWADAERRAALLHAFDAADGMMCAPRGFHYRKTSTAHSTRFLRTANVLESREHLALVAFWLLPTIWSKNVDQVIVDTSGIYAAALLAAHIIGRLKKSDIALRIWSHRSFDGLAQIDRISPDAVCLISATTSGTLRKELGKKGATLTNIWTIYGLARPGEKLANVLCDLAIDASSANSGHPFIENEFSNSCKYCKAGSLAVQISGDQFVLEPPRVNEVDFGVSDLPDLPRRLLGDLVGTGLFKAYRTRHGRLGGNSEIFLDVGALFKFLASMPDKALSDFWLKFKSNWKTLKARVMTANVERIVYTAHPFSRSLADEIASSYEAAKLGKPLVVSQADLPRQIGTESSGTIVAAACLDDQQELMTIKRDLRDVQKFGTIWFAAPLLRGIEPEVPEKVRKLIGYGEFGQGTFSLHHCCFVALPECKSPTVWDSEIRILRDLKEFLLVEGDEVPLDVDARETLLMHSVGRGLSDNLFWPAPNGQPLKLRNEFTLVPSTRAFSQADVYAVVSSFLHQLRRGSPNGARLLYTPFARSVLSPNLFTKYNDGVLQAALLRSARDHELHYANCDEATSRSMLGILLTEVREIEIGRGDALMEFFLALIDGRLTLMPEHVAEFCGSISEVTAPPSLRAAAKYLKDSL